MKLSLSGLQINLEYSFNDNNNNKCYDMTNRYGQTDSMGISTSNKEDKRMSAREKPSIRLADVR